MNRYRWFSVVASVVLLAACSDNGSEGASVSQGSQAKVAPNVQPLSSEKKAEADDLAWVYIDNGALQCEKPALPLSNSLKRLTKVNIEVKQSQCAHITGAAVAAMCGLKDLGIHMHQVAQKDIKRARSLGFEPIENLSHYGNKSFDVVACP